MSLSHLKEQVMSVKCAQLLYELAYNLSLVTWS